MPLDRLNGRRASTLLDRQHDGAMSQAALTLVSAKLQAREAALVTELAQLDYKDAATERTAWLIGAQIAELRTFRLTLEHEVRRGVHAGAELFREEQG